jgi:N-acyl-D-aspartate/D-glutamate deacylase
MVSDGRVENFGEMGDFRPADEDVADEVVDADGGAVLPSFCDSHTHLVYAGSREGEFVDKIRGLSYAEIARRGGGILNSADRLHELSEDELFRQAMRRMDEIALKGTGAVEIKSGYGLNTEDELKKYIGKSIRAYDASKDAAVRLESCKIDGSTVKIEMTYRTVQDYSNYNKVPCFLGTIAQARAAGFDVEQEYLDADGNKGDLGQILKRAKEWKIFIVSEPVGVRVSDKIIYATDNVSVTGRMTAEVQTVREDSGQENTSSADRKEPQEGSQDSSGKNGESETIDRLTTVADRYAYIIFK